VTCTLTVCRGCCCGGEDPSESALHLEFLRTSLPDSAISVSKCLGPCARKDVIVVHPNPADRQSGVKPVWLGWMSDSQALRELVAWVALGGPGCVPIPPLLTLNEFQVMKRTQAEPVS
jgi:hypothetical protein